MNKNCPPPPEPAGRRRNRVSTDHPEVARLEEAAQGGRRQLVADGYLVSKDRLAARLGVEAVELDEAVADERLFFLEVETTEGKEPYFPAFYGYSGFDRKELEKVTQLMGNLGGGAKWHFFVRPHAYFGGRTPLEVLEEGLFDEVERAALTYAER